MRGCVQFKHTHTHTPWEDQREWHRMTRMTRPDCPVMCNIINIYTHTHTHTHTHTTYNPDESGKMLPLYLYIPIYLYLWDRKIQQRTDKRIYYICRQDLSTKKRGLRAHDCCLGHCVCLCVLKVGKEFHRWDLQLGRYYSEVHTGLLYVVNDPRLFTRESFQKKHRTRRHFYPL